MELTNDRNLIECIEEDFNNVVYLKQFIRAYSNMVPFSGRNDLDEDIIIVVSDDHVDVATIQKNEVIRHNTYWIDGTSEEWFDM